MNTLDHADEFDICPILPKIASFARRHDGIRARVTRNGTVLLTDRDGAVRIVRTMRAACEWLGY